MGKMHHGLCDAVNIDAVQFLHSCFSGWCHESCPLETSGRVEAVDSGMNPGTLVPLSRLLGYPRLV